LIRPTISTVTKSLPNIFPAVAGDPNANVFLAALGDVAKARRLAQVAWK
jgi:hypothetical protein